MQADLAMGGNGTGIVCRPQQSDARIHQRKLRSHTLESELNRQMEELDTLERNIFCAENTNAESMESVTRVLLSRQQNSDKRVESKPSNMGQAAREQQPYAHNRKTSRGEDRSNHKNQNHYSHSPAPEEKEPVQDTSSGGGNRERLLGPKKQPSVTSHHNNFGSHHGDARRNGAYDPPSPSNNNESSLEYSDDWKDNNYDSLKNNNHPNNNVNAHKRGGGSHGSVSSAVSQKGVTVNIRDDEDEDFDDISVRIRKPTPRSSRQSSSNCSRDNNDLPPSSAAYSGFSEPKHLTNSMDRSLGKSGSRNAWT